MKEENTRLVVEGNAIYEIDRECVLRQCSQKGGQKPQQMKESGQEAGRNQRKNQKQGR